MLAGLRKLATVPGGYWIGRGASDSQGDGARVSLCVRLAAALVQVLWIGWMSPLVLAQQAFVAPVVNQQPGSPALVGQQSLPGVPGMAGGATSELLSPLPPVSGAEPMGEGPLWPGAPDGAYGGAPLLDGSLAPGPYVPAPPPLPAGPVTTVPRSKLQSGPGGKLGGPLGPGIPAYAPGRFGDFDPQGRPVDSEQERLVAGYYDPFGWQFAYGKAGAQPYKFGWYSKDDVVYVPESNAVGIPGAMRVVEWNSTLRYAQQLSSGVIFAWAPELNGKWWKEPGGSGLPPMGTQVESDLSLASVSTSAWNWQLGVTPQINSDFRRTLTEEAFMVDGRAVLFWQPAPEVRFALGAAVWDRLHVYAIPYAGVIWTPDDRWEFRLLLPKSRISYYMGKQHNFDFWLYGSGEYEIQAYQIDTTNTNVVERGQWSDYQLSLGVNAAKGNLNVFVQGGAILDRQVQFSGPTTDFRLKDAFILRTGLLY